MSKLNKTWKLSFWVLTLGFLIGILAFGYPNASRFICEQIKDGKWAPSHHKCIARDCADDASCMSNYNNLPNCEKLKTGMPKNEVLFHLGMPIREAGNQIFFSGGAMQPEIITVFESDLLQSFTCPKPE